MDSYFIDPHKRHGIKVLFPAVQFSISVDHQGARVTQKFTVIVEKMEPLNLVQIRLTELDDASKVLLSTIDNDVYERIRLEQAINVSYPGFIDHLIRILDSCRKEELHMSLVHEEQFRFLQFFERRPFKNLTHLFLPVVDAPVAAILFHINRTVAALQDRTIVFEGQVDQLNTEVRGRDETILQLREEVRGLKERIFEQETAVFTRNSEEVTRLQQALRQLQEAKDGEERKARMTIGTLQEKLEQATKDNLMAEDRLGQEARKTEALREEASRLKAQIAALKDHNEKLHRDLQLSVEREQKMETSVVELKQKTFDKENALKAAEKQLSNLRAELEAEKNICHTKRNALQIATDEISTANRIIVKQGKEIERLKQKVALRTDLALQQEKVIAAKDQELATLNQTLVHIQKEHVTNRAANEELAETLHDLRESATLLESRYSKRIGDLTKQMMLIK